jgi:hypothetical protein
VGNDVSSVKAVVVAGGGDFDLGEGERDQVDENLVFFEQGCLVLLVDLFVPGVCEDLGIDGRLAAQPALGGVFLSKGVEVAARGCGFLR